MEKYARAFDGYVAWAKTCENNGPEKFTLWNAQHHGLRVIRTKGYDYDLVAARKHLNCVEPHTAAHGHG